MSASKGQRVEVQITSGRWSLAQISHIVAGDTVNLVALTDGVDPWPTVDTPNGLVAGSLSNVTKGSSVGQWRELVMPIVEQGQIAGIAAGAVSLVGYATEVYCDAGSASAAVAAAAGCVAAPASVGTAVSLAINSTRCPSAVRADGRPTKVTAVVTWQALITGTAAAEVVCDSSSTPTTVAMSVPFGATLALGVGVTTPVVITFEVPNGWSYKVRAATGSSGTVALASIYERAL